MKNFSKTLMLTAGLLILGQSKLASQSMVGTVTQPCGANGAISVTVSGLTAPVSYTYSNWMSGQIVVHSSVNALTDSHTGIMAYQNLWSSQNTWFVSASDGVNTASQTFTIIPPFTDSIVVKPGNCPSPSTLQAMGFAGGTAPYSCLWTNQTTNQTYNTNPAFVTNGQYHLLVTDAAGCQVSTTTFSNGLFVMSTANFQVNITGSAANCTNGTATATAVGSGVNPYTYLWSNNATSSSLSGLSKAYYTCTVTDAVGCQAMGGYNLPQAVNISINSTINQATCLQSNGAITSFVSGGVGPYTFMWSNGATTQNLTGLLTGMYTVKVTDSNGCIGTGNSFVSSTSPINISYTATPSSCTMPTGSATLSMAGGQSPYTVVWYTFPSNSTGPILSNKPQGNYGFKITDANGCVYNGAVVIPSASSLNATLNNQQVACPATTGSLSVSVTGSQPPFTYLWSNAATGSFINGVPLGAYSCTITDNVGCKVYKSGNLGQFSAMNIGFITTPVTCLYNTNGAVTAQVTNGTAPYTYLWSNAQTGASATGLSTGNYYVYVTDNNGCKKSAMATVTNLGTSNNCYCTITGTVYADANSDCAKNSGEAGIPNIQVHCSNYGYAYTNANGVYSFQVPSGTYTISESVQQIYPLSSCQANNQVVSVTAAANCISTVNFANNVVPISDLRIITTNVNFAVPGSVYQQMVIVQNDGTLTESTIKVGYASDGKLTYSSCAPWSLVQQNATTYPNWYSVNSFPSLAPGLSSTSYFSYNVPTNIPVNTQVDFNDSVAKANPIATSWLTDNTPWNNVDYHQAYVVSSYDPNFKEVSPRGAGPQGYITSKDSILTYVVHFQNEGNYFAQNIVVTDTIDSHLQIASLRPGYSNHNYQATISETGVLKFTFKNINLPWKQAYGDALSSGMFTYSVKLKALLPVGTQIRNKAAIYFDYNEPVITNTTLNTISGPVGINDIPRRKTDKDILVYPNPATGVVYLTMISAEPVEGTLSIYDINGRQVVNKGVQLTTGENHLSHDVKDLDAGIYIIRLARAGTVSTEKLVISK